MLSEISSVFKMATISFTLILYAIFIFIIIIFFLSKKKLTFVTSKYSNTEWLP